jgi:hypothetical protein
VTKQRDVLLAVKALVQAALPGAKLQGFDQDASKPDKIASPGGLVIGYPGDPGEPEVDLSPPAYNYRHEIPLDVAAANGVGGEPLDIMVAAIGEAVAADRTLGGLCQYLDCAAAQLGSREGEMVTAVNWATPSIIAEYSTDNPLG